MKTAKRWLSFMAWQLAMQRAEPRFNHHPGSSQNGLTSWPSPRRTPPRRSVRLACITRPHTGNSLEAYVVSASCNRYWASSLIM
jgi:hypothetical protein